MNPSIAKQIADLLNERNQLPKKVTVEKVIDKKEKYSYLLDGETLIACAESKKVQWYQCEICHVSVSKTFEGKGYGSKILKLAEEKARNGKAKILQATIRSNNTESIRLFIKNDYQKVNEFYNPQTGNLLYLYQKSISKK